jgi:hypothetical protein
VRGAGLAAGSTLAAGDPSLTVTALSWMNTAVQFQVTVPAGAAPGHVDLVATNVAGDQSILPAALEITPPNPQVSSVSPGSGGSVGGTPLTVAGSGFRAGSRFVLGEHVYEDGQPGGCTVVDSATIQLLTAATPGGSYDAVVIDPTGVEGRETDAFVFASLPVISSVFPSAGSVSGGTSVVIRGSGFALSGCTVSIDGTQQSQVSVDDPTRITLVTDPGLLGGPYTLSVQNPGGGTSSSSFTFTAASDPSILSIAPMRGSTSGGETVTLHGSNLPVSPVVRFGVDPDTGQGGTSATSVTWVDASTLEAVTPAHASGATSVLVSDPSTGQAAILASAFTFASSGGGGGGCSIAPSDVSGSPRTPLEPLAGGAWLGVLAAILVARARLARKSAGPRTA